MGCIGGDDPGDVDETPVGQLCQHIADGDFEAASSLLRASPQLATEGDKDGMMPLHWAADRGDLEMVQLLLDLPSVKVKISAPDAAGDTALHYAVMSENEAVAQLLVSNGADVNATNEAGQTWCAMVGFKGSCLHLTDVHDAETAFLPRRFWHLQKHTSFGMGGDWEKMDETDQMLGGPPRKDWKDEKIFSDESEDMKKLQEMDRQKSKRLEKEDSNLKEVIKKEKQSVEDYEKRKQELQDEVEEMEDEAEDLETAGNGSEPKGEDQVDDVEMKDKDVEHPEDHHDQHEFLAQSRIVAPPYFDSVKPEDEIPVAVATTQEQWRRQRIAKDQVQVAQDQMQLAKDTQVLAEGQDKLTNLRTPGVAKEELLAEQELLVQSQKRLAEDMDNAIDGKLRWERLEDYRKQRIEKFQDMVNDKLDRLYREEIDFVKRNRKGKLRGSPINVPHFGPIGVRLVTGQKAALATGGEDGSEILQEKECPEDAAEKEAVEANEASVPVVHSAFPAILGPWAPFPPSRSWRGFRRREAEFFVGARAGETPWQLAESEGLNLR
eukprot:symbB.v1.2.031706.t2/scaffold3707.1/size51665/2